MSATNTRGVQDLAVAAAATESAVLKIPSGLSRCLVEVPELDAAVTIRMHLSHDGSAFDLLHDATGNAQGSGSADKGFFIFDLYGNPTHLKIVFGAGSAGALTLKVSFNE